MRLIAGLVIALAAIATPTFAADQKTPTPKVEAAPPPVEIEMPEIIIQMPAAKFEQAIVRDNEAPIVLLLV